MRRLLLLVPLGLALAACGGGAKQTTASCTSTGNVLPQKAAKGTHTLYEGTSGWAVLQCGSSAAALRRVGKQWVPDRTGRVKVEILGPQPGQTVAAIPQVAAQMRSKTDLVESALWIDGHELLEKGGGTPTHGTMYGAPDEALAAGKHVAVAYARTATAATALAWSFTAR